MRKIKFNKEELKFIKKYFPDFKTNKKLIAGWNKVENEEAEDLFWENIRWLIVLHFIDKNRKEAFNMKDLANEEFEILVNLSLKTACVDNFGDAIAASGLLHRLEEESKRRKIKIDLSKTRFFGI